MKNKTNIILTMVAFFIGASGMYLLVNYGPKSVQTIVNKSEKEVTVIDTGIADAVEKLYDAVVVVGSYKNGILSSSGTGFVYDEDDKFAYILTNSHVVDNSTSLKVKFTNENVENVELVANDPYSDIAVLKIEKDKIIRVAELGEVSKIRVGDTVFAIGAPLEDEYSWTVTRGILSGKDRLVDVSIKNSSVNDWVMNVMQTDAAINSGNSGGPLANSNGEVIGITNMKLVSDGVEGIGFAIPIEDAISYANELRKEGKIERPFLGISMLDASDTYNLARYRLNIDPTLNGAVVIDTQDGTPAKDAGLKLGDVITKIEDYEVTSVARMKYYLYKYRPGDKVKITYIRNNKTETTEIKLAKSE
ncbi:MAG: trypsin-like peptidase domain-containing protein [Bacilli bacterium]|nr:trypsin-like peptidase domain-containing protein [Bacilli bacterium]